MEKGYNYDSTYLDSGARASESPLNVACRLNHLDIVKLLLSQKSLNINNGGMLDFNSQTPLYTACYYGWKDIVHCLLQFHKNNQSKRRIRLFCFSKNPQSPIAAACQNGNYEIVKMVLESNLFDVNENVSCHNECMA